MIGNSTTLTNMTNGAYDLTVYINDTFGVAASQTVNFTEALPTAKPWGGDPACCHGFIGFGCYCCCLAGVIVYFRKRKH